MTPDEIAVLFRAGESDRVERKRLAKPDLKDIRRAICAFANDLSGSGLPGLVIVGQNDDGSCANIGIDDEFLRLLASSRGEVQPFPSIDVRRVVVDNCEIAVVVVQPSSSPPLRYDGRVWVRVGPTTQLASPADELRLLERRRMANVPFDGQPVDSATTGDLDLGLFSSQYLPSVVASDVLAANGRSQGQQLAALHLTTPDGVPTAAGLLVAAGRYRSGACCRGRRRSASGLPG